MKIIAEYKRTLKHPEDRFKNPLTDIYSFRRKHKSFVFNTGKQTDYNATYTISVDFFVRRELLMCWSMQHLP